MAWDETHDLVIVGSGGGSMCAALVAQSLGRRPLILEKEPRVGGSTSFSGGVLWIPANPFLQAPDSIEQGRLYLDSVIGDVGPASSPARREAYLRTGPEMLAFLQARGMRFKHAHWPDYYDQAPGGLGEGRSLVAELFDINELGDWADRLARFSGYPPLPVGSEEAATLTLATRTLKGRAAAARLAWRLLNQKLTGKRLRGSGLALQGRMLQIALREGVPIRLDCPVVDLVEEGGRVAGVVAQFEGRTVRIAARDGVLLDSGGFSHNREMREQYQPKPATTQWTLANPGDTGEVMQMAMRLGAAVDLMNEAWWVPSSFDPQGAIVGFHVPTDAAKPHSMIVGPDGRRFGNEAGAYMEFGQRMYAAGATPAWAILESRHRARYPWGKLLPGVTPAGLVESGYMIKADSLEELARRCGLDPAGLRETAERMNRFADAGRDEDFGRGASVYNRSMGDPTQRPNPCLGRIEKPPFYAVRVQPADVGTSGGLMTDEQARVLMADGRAIPGLYATGNVTASVMGRSYPGAGASIGASFVFGFIAAHHAARAAGVHRDAA